jgi:hypothetical protein
MTRLRFLAAAAGAVLIGCDGFPTGPAGDFPVEIEILQAHTIAVAMMGDSPVVLVEARITNPGSTEVLVQPECGGPFGLERWSGSAWEPYVTLADCLPFGPARIEAGSSLTAVRTFAIEPGTFRVVVTEFATSSQRERRSASFEVES